MINRTDTSHDATEAALLERLERMPLGDRLKAVVKDIASRQDRYRIIEPHALAELLGIDDAWNPQDGWTYVRFVRKLSVQEIVDGSGAEAALAWLQGHVSPERESILSELAESNDVEFLSPLSQDEIAQIEGSYQDNKFDQLDGAPVIALKSVVSIAGKELNFEGFVECDGAIIDLKTPYDERDGLFTDLEDCLTDEWTT